MDSSGSGTRYPPLLIALPNHRTDVVPGPLEEPTATTAHQERSPRPVPVVPPPPPTTSKQQYHTTADSNDYRVTDTFQKTVDNPPSSLIGIGPESPTIVSSPTGLLTLSAGLNPVVDEDIYCNRNDSSATAAAAAAVSPPGAMASCCSPTAYGHLAMMAPMHAGISASAAAAAAAASAAAAAAAAAGRAVAFSHGIFSGCNPWNLNTTTNASPIPTPRALGGELAPQSTQSGPERIHQGSTSVSRQPLYQEKTTQEGNNSVSTVCPTTTPASAAVGFAAAVASTPAATTTSFVANAQPPSSSSSCSTAPTGPTQTELANILLRRSQIASASLVSTLSAQQQRQALSTGLLRGIHACNGRDVGGSSGGADGFPAVIAGNPWRTSIGYAGGCCGTSDEGSSTGGRQSDSESSTSEDEGYDSDVAVSAGTGMEGDEPLVRTACNQCLARKAKCDGTKPCLICRRVGLKCTVGAPQTPRKKRSKSSNVVNKTGTSSSPGNGNDGESTANGNDGGGEKKRGVAASGRGRVARGRSSRGSCLGAGFRGASRGASRGGFRDGVQGGVRGGGSGGGPGPGRGRGRGRGRGHGRGRGGGRGGAGGSKSTGDSSNVSLEKKWAGEAMDVDGNSVGAGSKSCKVDGAIFQGQSVEPEVHIHRDHRLPRRAQAGQRQVVLAAAGLAYNTDEEEGGKDANGNAFLSLQKGPKSETGEEEFVPVVGHKNKSDARTGNPAMGSVKIESVGDDCMGTREHGVDSDGDMEYREGDEEEEREKEGRGKRARKGERYDAYRGQISRSSRKKANKSVWSQLRRACDRCTSKKVKCDGNEDCFQCRRSGVTCHFSICRRSGPRDSNGHKTGAVGPIIPRGGYEKVTAKKGFCRIQSHCEFAFLDGQIKCEHYHCRISDCEHACKTMDKLMAHRQAAHPEPADLTPTTRATQEEKPDSFRASPVPSRQQQEVAPPPALLVVQRRSNFNLVDEYL